MITGFKLLKRFRSVSGEKTLAFLILPTEQNAHSFDMVQEESVVEFDGDTYRIKQMNEKPKGQTYFKEVVAIHTLFDLIDDYVYEKFTGSKTFDAALQFVLGGTGYTWTIIDTFYAQSWENLGDDNRISLFQKILKAYGAEFKLSGTYLTFKQKIGNSTDFQFRYSYNIKTINRQVNTNNLSTYIKGFGKKNADGTYLIQSEYTSPNATIFGVRHAKPIDDERYTTLTGLNDALIAALKDTPDISITLDFVDLRRAGFPYDVPNEGDDVFLIYEPMNLDVETRIMDLTEEFTEFSDYPIKTDVTLANFRNNMTDAFVGFTQTGKTVDGIMDGSKKIPYNALDDAVKRATEALQSAQTELEFTNGIIARDKTNPNFLVLLNSAGIGVSLDGGFTFRVAMTAEGFVADLITVGSMMADRIKGGQLTLGGLDNGNGKMQVLNADGEVIADLDADRGGFSDLYVANLESPTVVPYSSLDFTFYVAAVSGGIVGEPNDTNDGLSWSAPLRTVTEAVRRLPKHLDGLVTIFMTGQGIYEDIFVNGFTGGGTIKLDGQTKSTLITGSFTAQNNSLNVDLYNCTFNSTDDYSVLSWVNTDGRCSGVKANGKEGNNTQYGIDVQHRSFVEIVNSEFYSVQNCIAGRYGGSAYVLNCSGYGSVSGQLTYGGFITGGGTGCAGAVNNSSSNGGSNSASFTSYSGGAYVVPAAPETTTSWNSASSDSFHDGYGVWDNTTDDPLQGKYGSAGPYRGCWFFGTGPSTAVTGKTIKQIRVYLTRANNSGSSGSVNAVIRPHGYTAKPGGQPAYLAASQTVGFKWGEGKWVTLPSSFFSLFQSGSAKGIMIYTGNTADYMRFSQSAKIEITYA